MNRREFLVRATIGGVSVPLLIREVGCSDDDDGGTGPSPESRTFTSSTTAGHSHTITIPNSDLGSTSSKNYTSSSVGHTHTVTLSAEDFDKLSSGCKVTKTSSVGDGHTHTWEIVYTDRGSNFDVTSSETEAHTHSVTIRVSDINTDPPTDKTYTTTSGGGHTHQVVVASADFANLVNCAQAAVTTTADATLHTHVFTIIRP